MERKEIVNISDYYLIDIIAVNETFNLTVDLYPVKYSI